MWVLVDSCGFLPILLDSSGFLWIRVGSCGFVVILVDCEIRVDFSGIVVALW